MEDHNRLDPHNQRIFTAKLRKLGKHLGRLRKARHLRQEDMAVFGFSVRYYQDVEAGKANPTLKYLFEISRILKVQLEELVPPR